MRDINRIAPFMDLLQECWLKFPDLRFGQLIEVIFKDYDKSAFFNFEEGQATLIIKKFMVENEGKYINGIAERKNTYD